MLRFLLLTGAILLMTDYAFAQAPSPSQCQQVKQAVARYGYAAARRYAIANYGPEAARVGDQCFARHDRAHYTQHDRTHYRKHYKARSWS